MNFQQAPFTITHLRAMVPILSNSHFPATIRRFPLSLMICKGPHRISVETAYSHRPIGDSKSKTEKILQATVSHVVSENTSYSSPTELFISYFLTCACTNKESLFLSLALSLTLFGLDSLYSLALSLSFSFSVVIIDVVLYFFDSYIPFTDARSLIRHLLCLRRVCEPSSQHTVCCLLSLFQERKGKRKHSLFSHTRSFPFYVCDMKY